MAARLKMQTVCEGCGATFRPYIREQKYCRWKCYIDKYGRPKVPCAECGKDFQRARQDQRFCSRPCAYEWARKTPTNRGAQHYAYKGGTWENVHGYVNGSLSLLSPEDRALVALPGRKLNTYLVHRLVMAKHLGRPLKRGEIVHHKNGNKADNKIENLELWFKTHPNMIRAADAPKCPHCGGSLV